ncbi:MAG: phosphotransferase [Thermoanaerobaculia bacterium]|nr:phosphotransferase [Thermoanaerobaculia bacterium]
MNGPDTSRPTRLPEPGDWASSPPPGIAEDEAARLVETEYGRPVRATALYAERDANFRLDFEDGTQGVLKVSHQDTDPATVDLQVRALLHVEQTDVQLAVPRTLLSRDGRSVISWTDSEGTPHLVRVMSWLDGRALALDSAPEKARRHAGRFLARLGHALRDCDPSGVSTDLPWDLTLFSNLRPLIRFVDDAQLIDIAERCFDRFEESRPFASGTVESQLIHNDFNPDNVLFDTEDPVRVSGVIDFSDMVEAPLICDLAIACAYLIRPSGDPVRDIEPMVRGYHSIHPLALDQLDLLLQLVECRLMTTLLIQAARAASIVDDPHDFGGSSREAGVRLRRLAEVDAAGATRYLKETCS